MEDKDMAVEEYDNNEPEGRINGSHESRPLKGRAVRGTIWSGVGMSGSFLIQLAVTVALARLLSPAAFGLMAMVTLVGNFATMFGEMGLGAAVISRDDVTEVHLSSFFAANLAMNLAIMLLVLVASPFIARAFNHPEITGLLRIASLGLPMASLGLGHRFALQKRLMFRPIAVADLAATSVYGAVGIAGAVAGLGTSSLAWAFLFQQAARSACLWLSDPWRPQLSKMRLSSLSGMWSFGLNVTGERVVNYIATNIDTMIIGRFIGATPLGYYDLAWRITMLPWYRLSPAIGQVAFPTFSLMQADKARLRSAYLKLTKYTATATFPTMFMIFILAPEAIRWTYGPRWQGAAMIVQLLALAGLVNSVGTTAGNVFYSQGRADLSFRFNVVLLVMNLIGISFGAQWGIVGIAIATSALSLGYRFIYQLAANRLIDLKMIDFLKSLALPFSATAVMALPVAIIRQIGRSAGLLPPIILIAGIISGAFFYACALLLTDESTRRKFKGVTNQAFFLLKNKKVAPSKG